MSRITKRFAELKADRRAGLVTYVTAGDPDLAVSYQILKGLPAAGADLIAGAEVHPGLIRLQARGVAVSREGW